MSVQSEEESNPYSPSDIKAPHHQTRRWGVSAMLAGAAYSVASSFPIAGIVALVFRFPVPLVGYVSGLEAVVPAMLAVLIYGVLLGGFVLLSALGASIGCLVYRSSDAKPKTKHWLIAILCVCSTTFCLLILAILDKWIGPW